MRNRLWLPFLILLLAARPSAAGIENAGTTGANFLSLGAGAGVLGMGGATLGSFTDLNGVSWNAASLGVLNETQLAFSHAPLAGAGAQDWMAYGGRMGISRTHWAITGLYQGDGAFEGRDALGNPTGSFSASSMAFGATLAQSFGRFVTVGVGGKVVTEKLADASGFGGTFDAGVLVQKGLFGFGLAAQNLGGRMKYGDVYYSMPTNVGAGVSLAHPASGLRVALDVNHPSAYYNDVRGGVEWMWRDRVAIRTGYRHELGGASSDALNGPTFGMGAGVRGLWFDYGYLASSNGDGEHRIALRLTPHAWGNGVGLGELGSKTPASSTSPVAGVVPPAPKEAKASRKPEPPATRTEPLAVRSAVAAPKAEAPAPKVESITTKTESTTPRTTAPKSDTTTPKKMIATPKSATPAPPRATALAALVPPAPTPAAKPVATRPAPLPAVAPPANASKPVAAPASEKPIAVAQPPAPTTAAGTSASPATTNEPVPVESTPKTPPASVKPAASSPAPVSSVPRPDKVRLKAGETLIQLARRYDTSVPALMMENNLVSDQVKVGQVIKIPNHK